MSTIATEDTRARVKRFIASNFYVRDAEKLADATSLVDSGIVDSTGILEVLSFLEQELGVLVEDTEVVPANLDSINNIVAFVDRKRTPQSTAA